MKKTKRLTLVSLIATVLACGIMFLLIFQSMDAYASIGESDAYEESADNEHIFDVDEYAEVIQCTDALYWGVHKDDYFQHDGKKTLFLAPSKGDFFENRNEYMMDSDGLNLYKEWMPWDDGDVDSIERVVIYCDKTSDGKIVKLAPVCTDFWFLLLCGVKDFYHLENIDMTNLVSAVTMFGAVGEHAKGDGTNIDVSKLKTSNKLKDVSEMFVESYVKELNFGPDFDTSSVESMRSMFQQCPKLTKLDISCFNTRNVEDMSGMFYESNVSRIDIKNFATAKCKKFDWMFAHNPNLEELVFGPGFDTSSGEDMKYMFTECTKLGDLDVSHFNTQNVKNMRGMFKKTNFSVIDVSSFNTANCLDFDLMFAYNPKLEKIYASSKFCIKQDLVDDDKSMFQDCSSKLKGENGYTWNKDHIGYEYARIDESNVEGGLPGYFSINKGSFFWGVHDNEYGIRTLYISPFENDNANLKAAYMLDGFQDGSEVCPWEQELNNIQEVSVCSGCDVLGREAKLSPTDTSFWFKDLWFVNRIVGLENINGTNVTSMEGMFKNVGLFAAEGTDVDLYVLQATKKLNNTNGMFCGSHINNLSLSEDFDTSEVTDMRGMFSGNLKEIHLPFFNTQKCKDMNAMFQGVESVELDLSSFDTFKCVNFNYMFAYCVNLKTIKVTEKFIMKTNDNKVFFTCPNLKGECGTEWTKEHTSSSYGHIDQQGAPGYFTKK